MLLRDIRFDKILRTSTEVLQAHLQQIKYFAAFHVASFLHMSQLGVPVPEFGISSSKPYRIFKSPLISLIMANN